MGLFSLLGSPHFRSVVLVLLVLLVVHRLRGDDGPHGGGRLSRYDPRREPAAPTPAAPAVPPTPQPVSGHAEAPVAVPKPPPAPPAEARRPEPRPPSPPLPNTSWLCCHAGCGNAADAGRQWLPSNFLDPSCGHGLNMKVMMPDDCPALRPPPITYGYLPLHAPKPARPPKAPKQQPAEARAVALHRDLAALALSYLEASPEAALNVSAEERLLVDWTFRGSRPFALPARFPRWTFVTAYLPDAAGPPLAEPLSPNHVLWNPATAHRLRALSTTMNMFDYGLLLRTAELEALAPLSVALAHAIPMARKTLVLLPCNTTGDADLIARSLQGAAGNKVGLQNIKFTITAVRSFTTAAGACTKTLWLVRLRHLEKGVKHSWCDAAYPWNFKFNFTFSVGKPPTLTLSHGLHIGEVRTLRHWTPSINLSELFAWGVAEAQRWVLLWDAFNYPSYPDAAVMNWLLAGGARVFRIDWDNPFQSILRGDSYTTALLGQFCLPAPSAQPACQCCQKCFGWRWGPHTPPAECLACYLCQQREFRSAFSPRAFAALVHGPGGALDADRQRQLECTHNAHMARKHAEIACYPYTPRMERAWKGH